MEDSILEKLLHKSNLFGCYRCADYWAEKDVLRYNNHELYVVQLIHSIMDLPSIWRVPTPVLAVLSHHAVKPFKSKAVTIDKLETSPAACE